MIVPMAVGIKAIEKDSFFVKREAFLRPQNDKKKQERLDRHERIEARLMAGEQLTIEQISIDEKFSRSHCGNILKLIARQGLVHFVYIPHQAKTVITQIKLFKLKADKLKPR